MGLKALCIALLLCVPQSLAAAPLQATPVRVALFLEYANDNGPADALVAGLERAHKDAGIIYDVFTIPAPEKREAAFLKAADSAYDLVIAATPAFHEILMNHAGNYRRTRFGAIDSTARAPHIATVMFADAEAAYLCGFAATAFVMALATQEPPMIGFIGNHDTPVQRALLLAYSEGSRAAHNEARVLSSFLGTFDDVAKAKRMAELQYSQGAQVIMDAAGAAGRGIGEVATAQQRFVIGQGPSQSAQSGVLFVRHKATDTAVYDMARSLQNNTFQGGTVTHMTLANAGVGITPLAPVLSSVLSVEKLTAIHNRLKTLEQDIVRGHIKIAPPRGTGCTVCED